MIHLRAVAPTGTTDDVLGVLHGEPGATNIAVVCAAREPPGDLIFADLARESVPAVLTKLRRLASLSAGRSASRPSTPPSAIRCSGPSGTHRARVPTP
jgi:hypothetical protein